jgi:hypothetical protein
MMHVRMQLSEITFELNGVRVGATGWSKVAFFVPGKTVPGANARETMGQRMGRVTRERDRVALCWPKDTRIPLPCKVQLTRVRPGGGPKLDRRDNLGTSLKAIADEVARLIGVDDADPKLEWLPDQETTGDEWGVWVEITSQLGGPVLEARPRPSGAKQPRKAKAVAGAMNPKFQPKPSFVAPPKSEGEQP